MIEELTAIAKVRNSFPVGKTCYLGCQVDITEITAPYQYVTSTGRKATKSTRYIGRITFPDGNVVELKKNNGTGYRGGEIARLCGLFVRLEKDAQKKLGNLYEITNRRNF